MGICGHFDVFCDTNKHTLENGAMSTMSGDFVSTVVGVKLINGSVLSSFTAGTSFSLLLLDSRENVLFADQMFYCSSGAIGLTII